ncbi:MAG: hypothetical protein DI587_39190 [Variovorax paradoxus]|nr:MAG: hypothetical protein DI583_39190 [Variovorax paradoxus]PZP98875.1 MAG: hypothetical protein DI587_39190 [Variovorax paradoxus]
MDLSPPTTISFARLRTFVSVAKSRSFAEAAATLDVTQSAVSKNMAQLEAELEQPLFRRNGRGVDLTPSGEVFYESIFEHVESIEATFQQMQARGGVAAGRMRITAISTMASYVLPGVVARSHEGSGAIHLDHDSELG